MSIVSKWSSLAPQLLSVLRIVAALMFMLAGTMKIFAFPAGMPPDGGTATFGHRSGSVAGSRSWAVP